MLNLILPRPANKVAVLACLLAITSLVSGSWLAGAQSSDIRPVQPSGPSGSSLRLEGHVPARVLDGTAIRVAHRDSTQHLRLAIYVRPPHRAEEEQFIRELTTKGSPNFHKFMTLDEWNARFAPSVEDEQAVVDWAKSQGLTVTNRFPNRLLVDVEGTIDTIEKAFDITINNYQVDDEVDFANDRDPVIPAKFSGIIGGVLGLNSIERFHGTSKLSRSIKGPDYIPGPVRVEVESAHHDGDPAKRASIRAAQAERATLAPDFTNNYADPADIFTSQAYNWDGLENFSHCCNVHNDSGGSPPQTSIALATFAGFNQSDLDGFVNHNGMAYYYNAYRIDGTSGTPGTECSVGATGCASVAVDDEATLDIEYSTASANSYGSYLDTAHVYMYEAANSLYNTWTDMFNFMLNDGHARVMSTSWSGTEATSGNDLTYWEDANDAIFANMVGAGWTLIGDADDQGSTGNCSTISVNFPASDPHFIAAGGTELGLYSNGEWASEVAWTGGTTAGDCGKNDGGGGGGVSAVFAQPYWQASFSSLGSKRLMPDISLNAGGIGENYYYNGTLSPVGGTSIVAPELAGFFAQENTYLNYIGSICGSAGNLACTPVGLANPFFYEDFTASAPHDPFYDITSGCTSNDVTLANNLTPWCAFTGYDLATGLGSANMMQLAWGINWQLIPAYGLPAITFNTTPAINTWFNTDQIVGWTVADNNVDGSTPPPGVAGFTQGWDSIPADPHSEPHGGSGNSFYSGPQYPFATAGCLAFNGDGGCAGSPGQGCHTAYVEAWDNQGRTATASYGPVCYDTVAPTITPSTNPSTSYTQWVNKAVQVTLAASDPGGGDASGIKATYYGVDTGYCYVGNLAGCTVYNGPFTQGLTGQNYIYYFTEDNAGNYSPVNYIYTSIDETAPTTTATPSGDLSSGSYYSNVSITLSASDTGGSGVANTYYILDGAAQATYSGSAIVVSATGTHVLQYWSVDNAGNVEKKNSFSFAIAPITPSVLTGPTPGSTLPGPSSTFTWTTAGGATGYWLFLGSTGYGSKDIYDSGETTATSLTYSKLPLNGEKVYASVYTMINGTLYHNYYAYYAATQSSLATPSQGATLAGPTVTFDWSTAKGTNVEGYWLFLGTTGVGSKNIYDSGEITAKTATLTNMPVSGGTIYARIYTSFNGTLVYKDYTYTAAKQAMLTTPTPSTTLSGTTVTFDWSAATGTNVEGYWLFLGTTGVGSKNLYDSGETTALTETVSGLPTSGTVYARVYTSYNGTLVYKDYTYTAQ